MAYDSDTLDVFVDTIGGSRRLLTYQTADTKATVLGTGYFSDLKSRGGQVNDLMVIISGDGAFVAQVTAISTAGAGTVATTYEDEMLALQSYVDSSVAGAVGDAIDAWEGVTETKQAFTPTMAFATEGDAAWTVSSAEGYSVKQGSLVFFSMDFQFTVTHTTASGALQLGGLPIAAVATSRGGGWIRFKPATIALPSGAMSLYPFVPTGASYVNLYYDTYNTASTVVTASHVTSGGASAALELGGWYIV